MRKDKAFFEKNYFANYDEQDGNGWGFNWRASQKKRMENAVRFMGKILKKKDLTVLEAGCATADMTRLIYENIDSIKRYDAFDISDIAIKICKTKGMDQINWMVCNLTDMNFIPDTYDLIICSEAIVYLSFDQQKVCIEKFYSYLKRGGVLFLSMHDAEYGENFKPVLKCFRKKKIFYNRTWLWTKIEYQLFRCYRQSNKKIFKRLLRLLISNEKLMEFFNKINEIFLPNKIQHIFLLLKK
ncbi:MAG: class I SAM-dependent methyltransferase [Lachnospiraceae bacterium]|nr:class I SAM-dependent methyltransferase [Lachnospiraceae bacterium]